MDDDDPDDPGTTRRTRTRTRTRTRRTGTRTTRSRLRRLDARRGPPAPVAWIVGTLLGGAAGGVFHLWEALILTVAGVPVPTGDARSAALAVTGSVGAVLGAWAAAPGLYGPRWATTGVVTLAGWLGAAPLGTLASDLGVPAGLGVGAGVVLAVGFGQVVGRAPAPAWAHQGFATGLFVILAIAVPLHVSVLPGPTTPGAVLATAMVALLALIFASGAASIAHPDRAPWLPIGVAGLGALALHGLVLIRPAALPATVAGPQVLVVVVSGLRGDRLGPGGALGRFADGAIVYTEAHATSNWTVPSLASALTGRLPSGHGAGVHDGQRNTLAPLRPDVATAAQLARRSDRWTAAVVGDPTLRTYALDAGFARWRDDPGQGARPVALAPLGVAGLDPSGWAVRGAAEHVVDQAIHELAGAPDGAWLVLVQFADAAGPFATADDYDDALREVDRAFGRLIAAAPPEAWVIVFGDRGVELGEPRGPRGGTGRTMFQELVHVPLMVRSPGGSGGRVTEPVSLVDVAPTVLAALGVDAPDDLDGTTLGAPFGRTERPRTVVAQASRHGPELQMVRVGRYKLIQTGRDRTAVFDLAADPAEASPLKTESRENDVRERKLQALLPPVGAGAGPGGRPGPGADLGRIGARLWSGQP